MRGTGFQKLTISAIIPTYNRAKQVKNAIKSVLEQSYPACELIVADDGSTDNTTSIVRDFGSSVKLISRSNQGKAATLNCAIKRASGEWIAVLDDDDTWTPDKLSWQVKALTEYANCRVCFSNSAFVNHPTGLVDSFTKVRYEHANLIGSLADSTSYVLVPPHGIFIQSCVIDKKLLLGTGGFDEQLRAADDTDMIFRLSLRSPFCYVNLPLTRIDRTPQRPHGLTDSRRTAPEVYLTDQEVMYGKWLNMVKQVDGPAKSLIRRRYAEVHNAWANLHISRAEYPEAIERLDKAYRIEPMLNFRMKALLAKHAPFLLKQRIIQK